MMNIEELAGLAKAAQERPGNSAEDMAFRYEASPATIIALAEQHRALVEALESARSEIAALKAEVAELRDELEIAEAKIAGLHRLAEIYTPQRWIPVSEQKPPPQQVLLRFAGSGIVSQGVERYGNLGEPSQDRFEFRPTCCGRFGGVTHWMPLPWFSCPKHTDGCSNDGEGEDCNCGADKHNAALDDLRAFLSKFVLCEREPICTAQSLNEFPEGRPHPLYSIVVHDRGSMQDGLNLHAPAKGVP